MTDMPSEAELQAREDRVRANAEGPPHGGRICQCWCGPCCAGDHANCPADPAPRSPEGPDETVTERPEGPDEELRKYLASMDRAGGGIYTADFRDGFRHALAMLASYESCDARAPVREAAREALSRRPAPDSPEGPDEGLREADMDRLIDALQPLDNYWQNDPNITARLAHVVLPLLTAERERLAEWRDELLSRSDYWIATVDAIDITRRINLVLTDDCGHEAESGDEGPVRDLPGGWPVRWRCDGCGRRRYDDDALRVLRKRADALQRQVDAALAWLDEHGPLHTFDCDRFEVYDYGTRQGKCDCAADALRAALSDPEATP